MKVRIKDFSIDTEIKNKGIEFEVRDNNENLLGDCYLTKTSIIWCQGKTQKKNGKFVNWNDFIEWMEG